MKLGLPCVYYKLNEKEGTGQIHDHSGYALHAKAVGGLTSAPGLAGDAVAFAGETYVECPQSLRDMAFPHMEKGEVVSSITLTLLVKLPAELTAPPHTLFCTHAREQGCHYENGYLFFWHFYTGRKKVVLRVPVATLLGQWVHTAWVLHDGTLYAYVNGVEHCSAQFAQIQPGNCGGPFLLGGEYNSESTECGPKPSCRSPLQHFAVFPRKLSGAEIQRHMQAAGIKHST